MEDGRPSENREADMVRKSEERQHHGLVSDDSAQAVMLELVLPTLRPMCKTNPNDDRGQNRKTSFSHRKMNISVRLGVGGETFFYETNPNGEIQDA